MERDHWSDHARQWALVRSPLRPGPEDAEIVRRAVGESAGAAPTLVVLGVTPELCGVEVPDGGRVVAVDRSVDMIDVVWPGRLRPRDEAVCADWLAMPLVAGSASAVLLDGGLSMIAFPDEYDLVCAEVRRVLRDRGRWAVRCFVSPDRRERLDDVLDDLARSAVANFHALKWRLAMAIEPDAATGVAVCEVYDALASVWSDPATLARHTGWPVEEVRTIEAYRGVTTRYTFPSLGQYHDVFARGGFSVLRVETPSYALGERCPTFVLERR